MLISVAREIITAGVTWSSNLNQISILLTFGKSVSGALTIVGHSLKKWSLSGNDPSFLRKVLKKRACLDANEYEIFYRAFRFAWAARQQDFLWKNCAIPVLHNFRHHFGNNNIFHKNHQYNLKFTTNLTGSYHLCKW